MKINKIFAISIFGMLLITSFAINSSGTVTMDTDDTISDDTSGATIDFNNSFFSFDNGTIVNNITVDGRTLTSADFTNWDFDNDTSSGDYDPTLIWNSNGNNWSATGSNIQNALDDLSGGGWVTVPNGSYIVSSDITISNNTMLTLESGVQMEIVDSSIIIGSNVTLSMYGATLTATMGNAHFQFIIVNSSCENSRILGGELDGNYSTNPDPDSYQQRGIATTTDFSETDWAKNLVIRDVYIHDTTDSQIVPGGEHIVIDSCRFANSTTDHGVYISMQGDNFGSHITNCEFSGFFNSHVVALGGDGATLSHCTFHKFVPNPVTNDCTAWVHAKQDARDIIIDNNVVRATDNVSVEAVLKSDGCIFSNNNIKLSTSSTNQVVYLPLNNGNNITIVNNRITGYGNGSTNTWGIIVMSFNNTIITGNHLYSAQTLSRGICLTSQYDCSFEDVIVADNYIDSASNQLRFITAVGNTISNVSVHDNIIKGNVILSGGNYVHDSMIHNNIVTGTFADFSGCDNVIVKNNLGYNYNSLFPFYAQASAPSPVDNTSVWWYDTDNALMNIVLSTYGTTFTFTNGSGDDGYAYDGQIHNSNGNNWSATASNLQSAIDDLSGGGTVWIPAGTITITTPITVTYSGITLQGAGINVTRIKMGDSEDLGSVINADTVNNITIRDLTIDGNNDNNADGTGLYLDVITDYLVENVYCTGMNDNNFVNINCTRGKLSNIWSVDTERWHGMSLKTCNQMTVSDFHVFNIGQTSDGWGLDSHASQNVTVTNMVVDTADGGMKLKDEDDYASGYDWCEHWSVSNCVFTNLGNLAGFHLISIQDSTFSNVQMYNVGGKALIIGGTSIHGRLGTNNITLSGFTMEKIGTNTDQGIVIYNSTSDITFRDMSINDINQRGMFAYHAERLTLDNVRFDTNGGNVDMVYFHPGTYTECLYEDINILNSKFLNSDNCGVRFSDTAPVNNLTIWNCIIDNCDLDGILLGTGADWYIDIIGNKIRNNGGDGIDGDGGDYIRIKDNTFFGNTGSAFANATGASYTIIEDNWGLADN